MSVKINGVYSEPKLVSGGAPQGCLLGGFIFCMVLEVLNCGTVEITPNLSTNGRDLTNSSSDEDDYVPLSPIARPALDIAIGVAEEVEEDEMIAVGFARAPVNRIDDTMVSLCADQSEIFQHLGLPERWTPSPLEIKVYVDDLNLLEKACQENAISHITTNKRQLKVHAPKIEGYFERVSVRAEAMQMKVNQKKTQILAISASINDQVTAYIRPTVGGQSTQTLSGSTLKIVGYTFGNKPNVGTHVDLMCAKFRNKLWGFRKLKSAGMSQSDLLITYKSVLRPIIEFASPTYGPMLTDEMSTLIEQLQLCAMKIIYGNCVSNATVLSLTDLEPLSTRRENAIQKFAVKTSLNPRFANKWFPKNENNNYNTRHPKIYKEFACKTSRLYNSPLYHMRRVLNNLK